MNEVPPRDIARESVAPPRENPLREVGNLSRTGSRLASAMGGGVSTEDWDKFDNDGIANDCGVVIRIPRVDDAEEAEGDDPPALLRGTPPAPPRGTPP